MSEMHVHLYKDEAQARQKAEEYNQLPGMSAAFIAKSSLIGVDTIAFGGQTVPYTDDDNELWLVVGKVG